MGVNFFFISYLLYIWGVGGRVYFSISSFVSFIQLITNYWLKQVKKLIGNIVKSQNIVEQANSNASVQGSTLPKRPLAALAVVQVRGVQVGMHSKAFVLLHHIYPSFSPNGESGKLSINKKIIFLSKSHELEHSAEVENFLLLVENLLHYSDFFSIRTYESDKSQPKWRKWIIFHFGGKFSTSKKKN